MKCCKFWHQIMLHSECCRLLVSSLPWNPDCWWNNSASSSSCWMVLLLWQSWI
jgi:hypothetical protein